MFDVYLITPDGPPEHVFGLVERALDLDLPAGATIAVQLRAKRLPDPALRTLASAIRALTLEHGVPMLLNGRLDVAAEVGADGVHLPEAGPTVAEARSALGASTLVGVSCHDAAGIARAAAGASFCTLSPVAAVDGKAAPLGVAGFRALARASSLPVLALGGVTRADVGPLVAAGARGVAVIRAVFDTAAPSSALRDLLSEVAAARASKV